MHRINLTLVCFLLFTIISSALAYKIVISAYSAYGDPMEEVYLIDHGDSVVNKTPKIKNDKIKE